MIARRDARSEADDAENRAVGDRGTDFLARGVCVAIIVDWKALARPDYAVQRARTVRSDVFDGFVDQHPSATLIVMAGDDTSDVQAHRLSPLDLKTSARPAAPFLQGARFPLLARPA